MNNKLIFLSIISILMNFNVLLAKENKADWTIVVYINGESGYESYGLNDLEKMKKIGSTKNVNLIALYDREIDPIEVYVKKNDHELIKSYKSFDSGDSKEFAKFVKRSLKKYPAYNYMLILSRHGSLWCRGYDYTNVFFRDGKKTVKIKELSLALKEIRDCIGRKIDLLGIDMDRMQRYEFGYELKEYVDYIVASQDSEPMNGWAYDVVFRELLKNSKVTSRQLVPLIVSLNAYSYEEKDYTFSGIDCSKFDLIQNNIDKLAVELIDIIKDTDGIILMKSVMNNVRRDNSRKFIDLLSFIQLLNSEVSKSKYNKQSLVKLLSDIEANLSKDLIISNMSGPRAFELCYLGKGLAVYSPRGYLGNYYEDLKLSNSKWHSFFKTYYAFLKNSVY